MGDFVIRKIWGMNDLDICIRTIDRGEVNYIKQTFDSLWKDKRFSDYEIKVFDSGSKRLDFLLFLVSPKFNNVNLITPKKKLTALENYIEALETEKDWVLVLGDDFMFCNDFFQNLEKVRGNITEEMRIIALFLTYEEGLKEKEFFKLPAQKFWGGNILIRREDAKDLANYFRQKVEEGEDRYMDILIKLWHIKRYPDKPIYMSAVGMCQHIGDNSMLGNDEMRKGFVGKYFPDIKK